jgi:hypothetical protein
MPKHGSGYWALAAAACVLAGCNTHHEIVVSQPKPMEVNVNLTGRLELVVTDARKDLEQIEGEKPKRVVTAQDIGLPATEGPPAPTTKPGARGALPGRVVYAGEIGIESPRVALASEEELKKAMEGRRAQVKALRQARVAGEAHTGLLVEKGSLSAAQQAVMDAENKDRQALYELEAQRKGEPVAKVALGWYVARLSYVNKGDWVEKFNKQKNQWEWVHWQE